MPEVFSLILNTFESVSVSTVSASAPENVSVLGAFGPSVWPSGTCSCGLRSPGR
jgi:hypothetical protein